MCVFLRGEIGEIEGDKSLPKSLILRLLTCSFSFLFFFLGKFRVEYSYVPICQSYVLVCYSYVPVCTRMFLVCYRYTYVTCMYSYVVVCYSYVPVCHSYVTRVVY